MTTGSPIRGLSQSRAKAGSGGGLRSRADDLAAVVVAAGGADVVRTLGLAAVRALDVGRGRQRLVGPAHVTTRLRNLLLRNCHWVSLTLQSMRRQRCCAVGERRKRAT